MITAEKMMALVRGGGLADGKANRECAELMAEVAAGMTLLDVPASIEAASTEEELTDAWESEMFS